MAERGIDQTLRAAIEGDQAAWRELVEDYSGRVYGLLLRQCRNAELAEEITQATFVKIVSKLPDYDEQGRFESWLFRIAINRLRDEMRRRKRQASTMDFAETPPEAVGQTSNGPMPGDRMDTQEEHDKLHTAIAQLPEADREVLYMRYTAELSFAQIAEALEQPLGTVLARSHRALKKLRTLLEQSQETA
ncbi:MAG: sigma-70 family RNA polymerase sigma factor [Phycisphaera sp.]|nr:sigma-70 family RNA polymerase sigma factor [Phycisphaera sp.]